jgi:hypothetical protein
MRNTTYILDPTVAPRTSRAGMATRPKTLDGLRVGLLSNGKVNADRLLEMTCELLGQGYALDKVVRAVKPGGASKPVTAGQLHGMAHSCDIVLTATGD